MKVTKSDISKHRKSPQENCLQKVSAERKEYAEVCVSPRMTETDITNANVQTERLLEKILTPENLNKAYKQVKKNKGAGGVDGMTVEQLLPYLSAHKEELLQSIWDGSYRPKPVRRVEIPKENGKIRKLGIPTVVDRLIQQAISHGVAKINVDTDIRLAITAAVRQLLVEQPTKFDPRDYLTPARAAVAEIVGLRMRQFGAAGHAGDYKAITLADARERYINS